MQAWAYCASCRRSRGLGDDVNDTKERQTLLSDLIATSARCRCGPAGVMSFGIRRAAQPRGGNSMMRRYRTGGAWSLHTRTRCKEHLLTADPHHQRARVGRRDGGVHSVSHYRRREASGLRPCVSLVIGHPKVVAWWLWVAETLGCILISETKGELCLRRLGFSRP